jgi:penicillin-binding protein 1C
MSKAKYFSATIAALFAVLLYISMQIRIPASRLVTSDIESLRLVDRHGVVLREALSSVDGRGRWLELKQISPYVLLSLIHTEDRNFFYHNGVDPAAILRATYQTSRAAA